MVKCNRGDSMKRKLSRNAMYLIGAFILGVLIMIGVVISNIGTTSPPKETKPEVLESMATENQVLKVQVLDFVSEKDFDDKYQEVKMTIEKDEEIAGVTINQEQSFSKTLQLLPPDENSPLLNHTSDKPTHNAYIFVLVGDIAKYKTEDGKEVYKVVNSRIEYYKQSLVLETDYNSVNIVSLDGKKEKLVKLPDYKAALSDVTKYMTMLQW